MIQQIGIDITATGAQNVAAEFNNIASSLQSFQTSVKGFNDSMTKMNSKMQTFYTAASKINDVGAHFTSFGNKAKSAISGLSVEMDKLGASVKALNVLGSTAGGGRSPGSAGSSGGMFGGLLGGAMGPFGFMARFMAFHQALRGLQYAGTDILMGRSREDIAKANLDMAAVSANKNQRDMIEKQAHAFSSKYGVTTAPEYIGAAAQTASAMDIQKLGAGTISTITEQNLVGSKMTNMNQAAFAEAQSKIMTSYLGRFDSSVRETLMSGGTATLPEFGKVNLQQMHAKIVAMTAKVVEKTNIWGQGLMDFYSYAGSMAGEKGMPLSDIFAMGGVMSDLGFKGAKSGRALKSILAGQAEGLANVMMIGEGKYKMDMTKDEKKAFADERRGYMAKINELSGTAEGQAQLAKMLAPGLSRSMAMSNDPNYALSLTKDLGISQDFLPQVLALYKDSSAKALQELSEQVKSADFSSVVSKFEDATKDAGWQMKKLSNTWSGFVTSLTTSVNSLIGDFAESAGLTAALNRGKELFDKHNLDKKNKEQLSKIDKRSAGGYGNYSDASGEDIMNLQSPEQVRDAINKYQTEKLKDRWGLAKTDEEKLKLKQDAWQEGRKLFEEFYSGDRWEKERTAKLKAYQDSGESPDQLTPELYSEYGTPSDTNISDYEFYKRYHHLKPGSNNVQRTPFESQWYKRPISRPQESVLDYMKQEMPQDQLFGQPSLTPELRSEAPNIELNPTFKIVAYIGDREIKDIVMEVQHEGRWSGESTSPGAGFNA